MAERDEGAVNVLVQVCIECGKEFMYEGGEESPENLTCDKCGNSVFRSFYAATRESEAEGDFREATERDTGTTDSPGDVTRGDLDDLGNL